jgi:hypothetical protein
VADKKSKEFPHQWPDGTWHSNTWQAHQAAMGALAGAPPKGVDRPPPKGVDRPLDAPPAVAPTAAATAGGSPPASGGSAQIVPDAQYLAEAAQKAFERTTAITNFTEEGKADRAQSAEAIRRMLADAVQGRQTIKEGANKEGLYYSGQLSKRQGDYDTAVTRATGDVQTQLQTREDSRSRAVTAIQQGAPLEDAIALASAGARQTIRDTAAADANALVPNVASVAAPGSPVVAVKPVAAAKINTKTKQPYTEQAGSGGEWHVYGTGPNARRVWVPKRR